MFYKATAFINSFSKFDEVPLMFTYDEDGFCEGCLVEPATAVNVLVGYTLYCVHGNR